MAMSLNMFIAFEPTKAKIWKILIIKRKETQMDLIKFEFYVLLFSVRITLSRIMINDNINNNLVSVRL